MGSTQIVGAAVLATCLIGALVVIGVGILILDGMRRRCREDIGRKGRIAEPPGVDFLEKVRIGGIDQWIHVRGRNRANPVLLFLHGGPGAAGIAFGRKLQASWEDAFTVVQWDQRGGGKTFTGVDRDALRPTMTIEQFIQDAIEVTDHVRRRLGKEKIALVGHSWGTFLGLAVASRRPDLVSAYVGSGQIVHPVAYEGLAYDLVKSIAERRGDRAALSKLSAIRPPPWSSEEFIAHNRAVNLLYVKYFDEIYGCAVQKPSVPGALLDALCSPEYELRDVLSIVAGARFCLETMFGPKSAPGVSSVRHVDVRDFGLYYDVPIFFFLGRHDYATPSAPAAAFLEQIQAPVKELVWFEHSGHSPMNEEPDAYREALLSKVRPLLVR